MTRVADFIADLSDYEEGEENVSGSAGVILPLITVAATGVEGVDGVVTLPVPTVSADATWAPIGKITLPALIAEGLDGEAIGSVELPAMSAAGDAHGNAEANIYLPPLAIGAQATNLPCGLLDPYNQGASGETMLGLLFYPDDTIAAQAAAITSAGGNDQIAFDIHSWVGQHISRVSDQQKHGVDEYWACPTVTLATASGDAEDGALLIHSLLLNAGVPSWRVKTLFGTLADGSGWAWTIYRRETDNQWVVLEWVDFTPGTWTGPEYLPRLCQSEDYGQVYFYLTLGAYVETIESIDDFCAENTGDCTLPGLSAAGLSGPTGTGAVVLPKLSAAGTGAQRAAIRLPRLSAAGVATAHRNALGAVFLPPLRPAGVGIVTDPAAGEILFPELSVAATAYFNTWGNAAPVLPALAASAAAKTGSRFADYVLRHAR